MWSCFGQDGITPLHRAAFQNHLDFARLLVEEGNADLNRKTQVGCLLYPPHYMYNKVYLMNLKVETMQLNLLLDFWNSLNRVP